MIWSSLFGTKLVSILLCAVVVCHRADGAGKTVRFSDERDIGPYLKTDEHCVDERVKSCLMPGAVSKYTRSNDVEEQIVEWFSKMTPPVKWGSILGENRKKVLQYCESKSNKKWEKEKIQQWVCPENLERDIVKMLFSTGFGWIQWYSLLPDEREEIREFTRLINPASCFSSAFDHIIGNQFASKMKGRLSPLHWDQLSEEIKYMIFRKAKRCHPSFWNEDDLNEVQYWISRNDLELQMITYKQEVAPTISEWETVVWFRNRMVQELNDQEKEKCHAFFKDQVQLSIKKWMWSLETCGWANICENGQNQMMEWGLKENFPQNWSDVERNQFWQWICPSTLHKKQSNFLSEFAPSFPSYLLPQKNDEWTRIETPGNWDEEVIRDFRQWVRDTVAKFIKQWLRQLEPQGEWDGIPNEVKERMIVMGMEETFPNLWSYGELKTLSPWIYPNVDENFIDNVAIKLWLSNLHDPVQWGSLPKSIQLSLQTKIKLKSIEDWGESDAQRLVMELHNARIDGIKIWLSQWDPTPDWNIIPHDAKTMMMETTRHDPPEKWSLKELQKFWPLIFPDKEDQVVEVLIKRRLLELNIPVNWDDLNCDWKQKIETDGKIWIDQVDIYNQFICPITVEEKIKMWISQWDSAVKYDDIMSKGLQEMKQLVDCYPVEDWGVDQLKQFWPYLYPAKRSDALNQVLVNRWLSSWNRPIRCRDFCSTGQRQIMEYAITTCPTQWGFEELITFKDWIYPETPTDKIQNWLSKNAPYVDMSKITPGVLEQVIDTMMNNPDKNWSEKLDKGIHDSAAIRFWLSQLTPSVEWDMVPKMGQKAMIKWGLKRSPFMWSEQEKDKFLKWIYPGQVPQKTTNLINQWLRQLKGEVKWESIPKEGQQKMTEYGEMMYPHVWGNSERLRFLKWINPHQYIQLVRYINLFLLTPLTHSSLRDSSKYLKSKRSIVFDRLSKPVQIALLHFTEETGKADSRMRFKVTDRLLKVIDLASSKKKSSKKRCLRF